MFDWSPIETVLLDMDGTILDLHFDNYFWREYLPTHIANQSGDDVEETIRKLIPLFDSTRGSLEFYCVDYWSDQLKLDIMELKSGVSHKIQFLPGLQKFLNAIKELDVAVHIATNAHRKVFDLKHRELGLGDLVDSVISSHDYKAPKEHQAFWAALQRDLKFSSKSTLFADDNTEVLDAAKKYGIAYRVQPLLADIQLGPNDKDNRHIAVHSLVDIMP